MMPAGISTSPDMAHGMVACCEQRCPQHTCVSTPWSFLAARRFHLCVDACLATCQRNHVGLHCQRPPRKEGSKHCHCVCILTALWLLSLTENK
jgi:hypothetical protein